MKSPFQIKIDVGCISRKAVRHIMSFPKFPYNSFFKRFNRNLIFIKPPQYSISKLLLRGLLCVALLFAFSDDSKGARKGRFTATDLQVFNPSFLPSSANAQWVDQIGQFQANLPINLNVRTSQYFTPELSGLVPATFIGGVEVISETGTVYATVTHFDKGSAAPDFERGNEHYEVRAADSDDTQLNAPVLVLSGTVRSNVSILSLGARPVTVTVQFHRNTGVVVASVITTVVGNALIDITDILSSVAPFSGTARLFSEQSVAGYVSIYDGLTQKGYMLAPKPKPVVSHNAPQTFTRSRFTNVQPTDDEFIIRTLYIQNIDFFEAGVVIRSRFSTLFTGTIPALGQIAYTLPISKAITEIFLDSDQHLEGVLLVDDANATDRDRITGSVAYSALSPSRDQALTQVVGRSPVGLAHCAVAPTVYGGYQGWQTSLRLLNTGDISGTAVVTYFPALGASATTVPIVVNRILTPGVSVIPDYTPIANSNAAWSAYIEADVPFVGDVTSLQPDISDGMMAYRLEPITCVTQPTQVKFVPQALR